MPIMNKFKKGDQVIIITGKDKGKRGSIVKVVEKNFLLVDGVNQVRKHQKPMPAKGISGGIVEKLMPIHRSNVAHYNLTSGRADKIAFRLLADGRKVRYFKSNNEVVDV